MLQTRGCPNTETSWTGDRWNAEYCWKKQWHIFLITNSVQNAADRNSAICYYFAHKQNLDTEFLEVSEVITVLQWFQSLLIALD